MKIITRFAPSPTGYLHVGGARTALFSYLYARHHGGQFELRIEDTDTERSTQESVDAIFEGMNWLGLEFDSEVKYQSKNLARYHEKIDQLLNNGQAYYCDCSKERIDKIREQQMKDGEKPRYDGKCRDLGLAKTAQTIIRFKTPQTGEVKFVDHVRGEITVANAELDDLVIARADGMPTYNFSVVIDDADMGITHVIRGDDHINNTPRQINIYQALGEPVPEFAHVPMILGDDGARLSKRHGAVSVMQYAEDGYLPEAVLNYLVRLGWSNGDQELFSKAEMIELFDLSGVNKAPSAFNTTKLNWINQQYMQKADHLQLVGLLQKRLMTMGLHLPAEINLSAVVDMFKDRAHTINELADLSLFLLQPLSGYDEKAEKKAFKESAIEPLQAVIAKCQAINDWAAADLHQLIADVVAELEVGFGKVGMPVRLALSGQAQGPSNDEIMQVLGQDETIHRLQQALEYLQQKLASA
ncbi:glutamate--tRNA ligase [Marinicella litoralis]|uniref:Glutamate--tRNA ligase n=1 Tax=Marinicella litoralis TaxID=644220 RepID=A0A4R6XN49_9GAMM|nr:glutamate--tRNA ligase [Marinicella litoralis]TDR19364.1 glutamyl-tRNA synthetase [Marinicella litoralis]